MDRALPWHIPSTQSEAQPQQPTDEPYPARGTASAARFGGDEQPVLIAVIQGPVEAEMARDALAEAQIPAFVKQNSLGPVYGLTVGGFGSAEVWVPPAAAEQAREVLIGIGLLEPQDDQ